MKDNRESDGSVVPVKSANNGAVEASAESMEERDPAKRNDEQTVLPRTPSRNKSKSRGLFGVREAARNDSKFTALLHHIDQAALEAAFFHLKKTAAVGIDGVTWAEYEQHMETNLADLHGRIHRGAYRAKPSLRGWIPKSDGRKRPLGIASLEDKIVQQAVSEVLQSIYEEDFLGFTHKCGRTRAHGIFTIHRSTIAKRVRATLAAIKERLRRRRHRPLGETGRWLGQVVRGWLQYHAVPGNLWIWQFVREVTRLWLRMIRRRSQKGRSRWTWERMLRLREKYLPHVRVLHPYPEARFRARLEAGAV